MGDIELREYTVVGPNVVVSCLSCNKPLLDVCSDGKDGEYSGRAECIKCNRKSFIFKVKGKAFIAPAENAEIVDVVDNLFRVQV